MALFIDIKIEGECKPECKACVDVCPVDIFAGGQAGGLEIISDNEDECTLCDLCLQRCPVNIIKIEKNY